MALEQRLDDSNQSLQEIIRQMTVGGIIAALCCVTFFFLRVDIQIGATRTSFHIANSLVVVAPLLFGAPHGVIAPALGLFIADLCTGYAYVSLKTFILKLIMSLVAYFVFKRLSTILNLEKANSSHTARLVTAVLACGAGLGINVILAPVASYFTHLLLGLPVDAATIFLKMSSMVTLVNAALSLAVAVFLYLVLRRVLHLTAYKRYLPKA